MKNHLFHWVLFFLLISFISCQGGGVSGQNTDTSQTGGSGVSGGNSGGEQPGGSQEPEENDLEKFISFLGLDEEKVQEIHQIFPFVSGNQDPENVEKALKFAFATVPNFGYHCNFVFNNVFQIVPLNFSSLQESSYFLTSQALMANSVRFYIEMVFRHFKISAPFANCSIPGNCGVDFTNAYNRFFNNYLAEGAPFQETDPAGIEFIEKRINDTLRIFFYEVDGTVYRIDDFPFDLFAEQFDFSFHPVTTP